MAHTGMSKEDTQHDLEVLNRDLYFEHRAVWGYAFAAQKLSKSDVGKVVLELGLQNREDHQKHQELLIEAIHELGGTPLEPEQKYDLSRYLQSRNGDLDSDVNIAKLALALEIDASIGYIADATKLKSPTLAALSAGIAAVEAIHAARIREAFNSLGVKMPIVASPVIGKSVRDTWVLKVEPQPTAHP
jgi:rubrerythrin